MLLALGRCRILSFDQLRRAVFPDLSAQRVCQRLHALAANGWLRIWEDVSRIGGRPRYALPTQRSLAFALDALHAASIRHASERLASLMLRGRPRRPLLLAPRTTPAFLAHQRECNDLLLAYRRIPAAHLLWSTSFDRPFPLRARGIALPQPDYVMLLERGGARALIFGEHDRGHESLAHFRRTKAERYAALAARPELTLELFGFERFMVWVTVLDARAGASARADARSDRPRSRRVGCLRAHARRMGGRIARGTDLVLRWSSAGIGNGREGENTPVPPIGADASTAGDRWDRTATRHAHAVRQRSSAVRAKRFRRGSLTTSRPVPSHHGFPPPPARTLSCGRSSSFGTSSITRSLSCGAPTDRAVPRSAPASAARGCARGCGGEKDVHP